MALALTLLGSGPALAQDVALIPPDERQQELWRYVLKLGDGTRAMKRPAVRLVELTGGAAYSDLAHGEVQLHPVHAFSGPRGIVELYLVHEYLHFVLYYNGMPAKLHHCWMARSQIEFQLALDYLVRAGQSESLQKSLIMHTNKVVRTWRRECQEVGAWWHPLVLGTSVSNLAN